MVANFVNNDKAELIPIFNPTLLYHFLNSRLKTTDLVARQNLGRRAMFHVLFIQAIYSVVMLLLAQSLLCCTAISWPFILMASCLIFPSFPATFACGEVEGVPIAHLAL